MKVCVILRKLVDFDTVVSAVIICPSKDSDNFSEEAYLKAEADRYIKDFKNKFVEFGNAKWDIVIQNPI